MVTSSLLCEGWPWCLRVQGRTRSRPRAEPWISGALPSLRASAPGAKGGRGAKDPPFLRQGPSPSSPPQPQALVSVHKPLIKQAQVTFPLIRPKSAVNSKECTSRTPRERSARPRVGGGQHCPLSLQSTHHTQGFLEPE